ncbi:oxidoreductase C-terminal domain-containing protein [Nocardia sp. NPDC052278]|uniref:oxidoreductase C-terminal domain-containing protein n=1 Tax=unclassified Nocardia TaxID=2637762 RepID=UPI0036CF62DB
MTASRARGSQRVLSRKLLSLMLVMGLYMVSFGMALALLPLYVVDELGGGGWQLGLAFTGNRLHYAAEPWFRSDQYDLKLQVVGLSTGYDRVIVRPDTDHGRPITVFYLRDNVVIAADVGNRPADFAAAKKMVSAGTPIDLDLLADSDVPLRTLVPVARPG